MALDATKVTAQTNDFITREQQALDRLKNLIATSEIVQAYAEYLALHANAQGRLSAASTAGITLTGVATEPTTPTASLTAASDGSGAPSLLSVLAAVVTTTVTAREALDADVQNYQNRLAGA